MSLIIPVHDRRELLGPAIESALAQDYEPLEVIVVDDGSTDGSGEVAASFPGVRLLRQRRLGPGAARNAGLAAARGELVAFLDSDDLVPPSKLSTQVGHLLAHPAVGCVLGRQEVRLQGDPPPWLGRDPFFGDRGGVNPITAVVRTAVLDRIGGFDAALPCGEDRDLLLRMREAGVQIAVVDEVVLYRRVHAGNLSHVAGGAPALLRSLKARLDRGRAAARSAGRPLVSVVITVYNCARYLGEAIDSVLGQTHRPLELIVVDDGSDDGSTEVALAYADRLRYLRHDRRGIGASRNRAVGVAGGEFLTFLDADDRFLPDALERPLAAFAAEPALDVVYFHVREFKSPDLDPALAARLRPAAARAPGRLPNTMVIRRRAFLDVGPFVTGLSRANGIEWAARALDASLAARMLPEVLLERRLHDANNGLRERGSAADYAHVLKAVLDRRRARAGAGPE